MGLLPAGSCCTQGLLSYAPCHWFTHSNRCPAPTRLSCSEMFSANHFIVSQTSPHIVPFLNLKRRLGVAGAVAESEFRHRCARGGLCSMRAQGWGGRVGLECCAGEPLLKAKCGTGELRVRSAGCSSSASCGRVGQPCMCAWQWGAVAPMYLGRPLTFPRPSRPCPHRCRQLQEMLPPWLPSRWLKTFTQQWEVRYLAPAASTCAVLPSSVLIHDQALSRRLATHCPASHPPPTLFQASVTCRASPLPFPLLAGRCHHCAAQHVPAAVEGDCAPLQRGWVLGRGCLLGAGAGCE